jgi:hypothetical protein
LELCGHFLAFFILFAMELVNFKWCEVIS